MSKYLKLFTCEGIWKFYEGRFEYISDEKLHEKEGLRLRLGGIDSPVLAGDKWKILRLTNNTLIIESPSSDGLPKPFAMNKRTLTFKKE